MTEKKRILILVKTYPVLSMTYNETVCTAGIDIETGKWVRIYPVPFRSLDYDAQFSKFQIIELELTPPRGNDKRPESRKIVNIDKIQHLHKLVSGKKGSWDVRKQYLFKSEKVFTNKSELLELAYSFSRSLAFFKPKKIIEFVVEEDAREWPKDKVQKILADNQQLSLFPSNNKQPHNNKIVEKIPYKFSYHFIDDMGVSSKLMIEDWEIFALYRRCLKDHNGDEKAAIEDVKKKYWNDFAQPERKDLHLILGTVNERHNKRAPNPFVIIGVLPFPLEKQQGFGF